MAKVRFFYALITVTGFIFFTHYPFRKFGLFSLLTSTGAFYLLIRAIYVPVPAKRYNLQHIALCAESKEIIFKPTGGGWQVAMVTWNYKRTPETEFTYTGKNGNGIEWSKNEVGIHRERQSKKVHTLPGVLTTTKCRKLLRILIQAEQNGENIFNFATLMQYADFVKLPLHKQILHRLSPSPTLPKGGDMPPESQPVTITFTKLLMFLPDMPDCLAYGIFLYHVGKCVLNFIYHQGVKDNRAVCDDDVIKLTSQMIEAEKAGDTTKADRLNRQILSKM